VQPQLQVVAILASATVLVLVIELIRKGRLREEYSLIWLASAAIIFLLSLFRGSLQFLADLIGVEYGPSLLFIVGLGLITTIQLMQTIALSKLTAQNRDLAQRLAILEWQLQHQMHSANGHADSTSVTAAPELEPAANIQEGELIERA